MTKPRKICFTSSIFAAWAQNKNKNNVTRSANIPRIHPALTIYRNLLIELFCRPFSLQVDSIERRNCGNKIVEDDEECDCGTSEECLNDPCCDSITCKLKSEAECASGLCCDNCKVSLLKILPRTWHFQSTILIWRISVVVEWSPNI